MFSSDTLPGVNPLFQLLDLSFWNYCTKAYGAETLLSGQDHSESAGLCSCGRLFVAAPAKDAPDTAIVIHRIGNRRSSIKISGKAILAPFPHVTFHV